MKKASVNCWTCKQRRVGCDRKLPNCENCYKGQRICQGYDLRLAWPEKQDGRRTQKRYEVKDQNVVTEYLKDKDGCLVFLNTALEDLNGSRLAVEELVKDELISAMSSTIPMPINLLSVCEQDGMLLNHYDMQVARITTTIDDESNGFRLALIPMALSSCDLSARSILHTILAIACYHLGRPQQALKHKCRAVKDLRDSFATLSIQHVDSAAKVRHFAASMMLCVYGVFDESDTAWHVHLEGAKAIFDIVPDNVKSSPTFDFLSSWYQYHSVLSEYVYPPRVIDPITQLPDSTAKKREIIGVLGCSSELLEIIGCINQQARSRTSGLPNGHTEIWAQMEDRLLNLQQELVIYTGLTSGTIDNERIFFTAELYRIAALLYLYQTTPATFAPAIDLQDLLRNGLNILWKMVVCSSPWPLFILACSASDDVDRIRMLDLMQASGSSRRIGNYSIIISLVKVVWVRQDLVDGTAEREVNWRDFVEKGGFMPSFI